jgi:hypothetical protein
MTTRDPNRWAGRRVQQAHALVATWLPAPCGKCGETVHPTDKFVTGHKLARSTHPELTWVVSNWQPEHDACSRASSQQGVIEKARLEGARAERERMGAVGSPCGPSPHRPEGSAHLKLVHSSHASFPTTTDAKESPQLPLSLSNGHDDQPKARDDLRWDPEALSESPWLQPFLDVPDNASPPLWMSRPPEDAVCSYGWSECSHLGEAPDAITWIETTEKKTLRWWQRLAIVRQLEHREDGSLCAREVLESAPRRAGKSLRLRGVILWRMEHGLALFGETQTVVHTGNNMPICREVQRGAWVWAKATKWTVLKGLGTEAIESDKGDRWLVRSQDSVYGYDVHLGAVDEAWDVKPDTVSEGLEPATLERPSPQLHITSTAHRRASSLMRGRLSTALVADDPKVLLLVWAAPYGSDPGDPEVWRAASPHWSEDRRSLIASKHAKALAGENDPELDDPDPMAGFASQYLNIWRLSDRRESRGDGVTTADEWSALTVPRPTTPPTSAAIESWFSDGVSLALGWTVADRAVVSVSDHPDIESAVSELRLSGFKGRATVGSSLKDDPALRGVRLTPGEGRTGAAATELRNLLREEGLWHDGGDHLTGQVLELRTVPGADGPRVSSKGRADGAKAAVWAAQSARKAQPRTLVIARPN